MKEDENKNCKYCCSDVDTRLYLLDEIYIDGNGNLANDDTCEDKKLNYCPICGKKL